MINVDKDRKLGYYNKAVVAGRTKKRINRRKMLKENLTCTGGDGKIEKPSKCDEEVKPKGRKKVEKRLDNRARR
jgi:hypothetical protein